MHVTIADFVPLLPGKPDMLIDKKEFSLEAGITDVD
jgi:hypothetical protein